MSDSSGATWRYFRLDGANKQFQADWHSKVQSAPARAEPDWPASLHPSQRHCKTWRPSAPCKLACTPRTGLRRQRIQAIRQPGCCTFARVIDNVGASTSFQHWAEQSIQPCGAGSLVPSIQFAHCKSGAAGLKKAIQCRAVLPSESSQAACKLTYTHGLCLVHRAIENPEHVVLRAASYGDMAAHAVLMLGNQITASCRLSM